MSSHLYSTTRWKHMRMRQLAHEPLCCYCKDLGHVTVATVADHVRPHRGNEALFFDANNLQSLCKSCHDGAKQQQERSGFLRGSNADGLPLDAKHPWYRGTDE